MSPTGESEPDRPRRNMPGSTPARANTAQATSTGAKTARAKTTRATSTGAKTVRATTPPATTALATTPHATRAQATRAQATTAGATTARTRTARLNPTRSTPPSATSPSGDGDLAPVIPLTRRSDGMRTDDPFAAGARIPSRPRGTGWEDRLAGGLAFLRRRITGEYEVDEFGFDPDLADHVAVPAFRPLFEKWFRTEVHGVENVPVEGGALLVANHGGALWALDAVMTAIAVHDHTPGQRYLRLLGADLVFSTPVLGPLARKTGSTLACQPDAERLLSNGELVGVWPEGFKGIGKPFSERYKLQRFGRGGFVTAALRTGAPIIPVSIVGAEEIHPMLFNAKGLARTLGLPYFPVTPTFPLLGPLGLVPLPSKWHIEFGPAIDTSALGPDAADDPLLMFELTDRVRETIQSTLYRLLTLRSSPWS